MAAIIDQDPVWFLAAEGLLVAEVPATASEVGSQDQFPVRVKTLFIRVATELAHETVYVSRVQHTEHFVDSAIDEVVSSQRSEVHYCRPNAMRFSRGGAGELQKLATAADAPSPAASAC
ncbi:MAG: hypothetical protein WBC51_08245 [Vicinamibacterales bacterium]